MSSSANSAVHRSDVGRFSEETQRLLAIDGKSAEEGELVVRQFDEANIDAIWIEADVSVGDAADDAIDKTVSHVGGIDLLVNNAAARRMTEFLEYDDDIFELSFENNLRMVYHMTR